MVFDGSYRARGRWFDTLSLDRDIALSEGAAAFAQHRLWLRPRFLLSEQVAFNLEVRGLDNVLWGDEQVDVDSPVAGAPPVFEDDLVSPTDATDNTSNLLDITLWRAWGDVYTNIGRFTFGRMPLHWGAGIWQNNGQTVRPHFADHGDTVDRVAWEYLIEDQVYVKAAVDVLDENFINLEDDTTAYNLIAAYRSELIVAGLNTRLRRNPELDFNLFTVDLALDARFGKLSVVAEGIGQFGGGDLEAGINEVDITAFGAVARGELDLAPWLLQLEGGFASGDGDLRDENIKTFTFDRDYSVGLFLFEQTMPTLQTAVVTEATGSRSLEFAQTGEAVSNALYLRPTLGRTIVDDFDLSLTWLGARAAKLPETFADRGPSYGMEFDLGASYTGIEHVDLLGMFGLFLPGNYFEGADLTDFEADFDEPVFGAQLSTRIHF